MSSATSILALPQRLGASVFRRVTVTFVLLASVIFTGSLVAGAIVPETPRLDTPIVLDGEVWDVQQVGNAVVVGGNFTQIQTVRNGPVINQAGLFAYDMDSGILLEDFLPTLSANNAVEIKSIVPAADGRSIYIGGRFTAIDDHTDDRIRVRNRIAKLDVTTGRLDRNFARGGVDAKVLTMDLIGNQLYVGGNFSVIYDTDVGRPPIEHAHHSLARFDASTGAYDGTFKFLPVNEISRTAGLLGVTNLDHTPDGQLLVVAHRGADIVDVGRAQTLHRPGLAIINLAAAGGPQVTAFQALFPDAADPIQDFYHRGQCGNRGIFIRDMEVSPDGTYFATSHQGADSGYQCDTVVRWPIVDAATRPTWISRLFDSVFSLGIADDAIYVGGHFRMMVTPEAPSSYPGETRTNGQAGGDIYTALETNAKFANDLFNPGYVYRAYQLGAINPTTGRGIESWNPGSDAFKGVLAITVVDRGLLLGQDRGRINGFNTGRAAFLDQTPDAGNPRCTVALDDDFNPTVSWTNIGNVSEWRIARNNTFLTGTTATSFTDTTPLVDTDLTYELRFNRNGISQTQDCGTVRVDLIPITCVVEVLGDTSLFVDWNNTEADEYIVRRDDKFQESITDRTRWEDTGLTPGTTYNYEVRSVRKGVVQSATCSATTLGRTLTCSAAVTGEDVTVSFNGGDFSRVTVRRDGAWQATVSDQNSFTETLPPGTYSYEATGVLNGFQNVADCGSVTVSARSVVCTVSAIGEDVTVSFNGGDFSRVTIRRDGNWQATIDDRNTYTETLSPGTYTYEATGIFNGFGDTTNCGSVTIDAEVLVCTIATQNNNVVLSWNDIGAPSYQVRTNNSWTETLNAGTTQWSDAGAANDGNSYQIRFRQDGSALTINCA